MSELYQLHWQALIILLLVKLVVQLLTIGLNWIADTLHDKTERLKEENTK